MHPLFTLTGPAFRGPTQLVVRLRASQWPWPALLLLITVGLIALTLVSVLAQTIRFVKPSATGAGDGSSWAAASGDLQGMITASASGDQVWVAGGVYKPTTGTDRNISFVMKDSVAIYGGFAGGELTLAARVLTYPSSTTLSGDIGTVGSQSDNSNTLLLPMLSRQLTLSSMDL